MMDFQSSIFSTITGTAKIVLWAGLDLSRQGWWSSHAFSQAAAVSFLVLSAAFPFLIGLSLLCIEMNNLDIPFPLFFFRPNCN